MPHTLFKSWPPDYQQKKKKKKEKRKEKKKPDPQIIKNRKKKKEKKESRPPDYPKKKKKRTDPLWEKLGSLSQIPSFQLLTFPFVLWAYRPYITFSLFLRAKMGKWPFSKKKKKKSSILVYFLN